MKAWAALLVSGVWAGALWAAPVELPGTARLLSERISALDSYQLPIGAFVEGQVPGMVHEGRISRWTWRLAGSAITTLQILSPLSEQLVAKGFNVLFECKDIDCGGFDFRFKTEVVPAPDMHVDIRNYRFLSATHPDGEAVSLLVSRSREAAYIQMFYIVPVASDAPSPDAVVRPGPTDLAETLLSAGHIVLEDLEFGSGAADLSDGPYGSLENLATFLTERPDLMLAIVGHTDSIGALEQNIELSRQRAEAVRRRLIEAHQVEPDRLRAEGMGYLSPIGSNLSEAGREANRRVEAIVLPLP